MKKARKLLVALLVLTFLLGTFNVGFAAAAEEDLPSHVTRALALGYLKGFEDGELKLDQQVTRAQALAFIIRISGLEASAELMKGQTQFADVNNDPSLQWATGYINLGVGQGIINGYPDGTFKGNNNVTYAEMAKMLLYAMNYGVTVEGGVWPAAVMGKADDLKLFDKVNAVPNVPALRGDVVKMIDNSLTIKHLVQRGYGDLKYFDEGDDTFLSKMKVTELEDVRVTAVDPKKAKITIAKKSYKVLADVDVESLLGMEVTAWVNDDDEIFFIDPDYDAVKIDIVKEKVAKDATKIKLKLADASYKIADNVNVYINGETADLDDLEAGYYGYFVFNDDDQILYINVKKWNEVNAGVVTEVDTKNNIIHYFLLDDNDNELDLDEPDDGYVITLDGEKIDLEDIEVNDVIYVAEYDDMYHVVVVRNSVEGIVDKAKDDEVTIDGETYKVVGTTTYSIDEDKNIAVLDDANKIKDMVDEKAFAILDIAGELRHITSDVKATSDDIYGVVTKVDDYNELVKIFANGSSKSYTIDGKIYEGNSKEANDSNKRTYTWLKDQTIKQTNNGSEAAYAIVRFALDKDGEIEDLFVLAKVDKDGDILNNYAATVVESITITKFNDKHDTITAGDTYFVTSTTSIIDEIDDMDAVEWAKIEDKDVPGNGIGALIVSNSKNDAKLVIFKKGVYANIVGDTDIYAVVLDKYYKGGDWKIKAAVHDGKETEYVLDSKSVTNIGEAIKFKLNSKDKIDTDNVTKFIYGDPISVDNGAITGKVTAKDGNYITINDGTTYTTYKADSLTLVYDVTDGLNKIEKASLSDIKANKTNVAVVAEGRAIKILYITKDVPSDGGKEITGLVTFIKGDKAVTSESVKKSTALALKVNFNNDSTANVSIPERNAKYQIVNNKTGVVAKLGDLNTDALVVLAGKSVELGQITDTLTDAGDYTIIVTVKDANDKVYEAELALKVLNTDDTVSKVEVKGVEATWNSNASKYEVEIPYGNDLKDLEASDIVVTPTDENATVGTATIELDNEDNPTKATVKVKVTAEDGETETEYTIEVTVAEPSDDATLKSLTVGGIAQTVPTEDPYEVEINLPAGSTEPLEVIAVANHPGAKVVITPAEDVTANDGEKNVTTIKVTAEDGETEKIYKVVFTVLP